MGWSFSIGRLFGSDLKVHATFFLLLLWIGAAGFAQGGARAAILSVSFVLALFLCVLAHEYGHALMARRFGVRTPDITLLPIGGMARLDRIPEDPRQEIAVALAGPAVNVVIWAALGLIAGPAEISGDITRIAGPQAFIAQLAAVNLFLAVFNLLPAFPMDGGRVLRAVLSMRMDRVRATRAAAAAGQVLAFGLAGFGLLSGNLILLLIALFVFVAANAESSEVAARALVRRLKARDAMITEFETLRPDDTLQLAANTLIRTTQHEFPVVDPDGRLVGFLGRQALFTALSRGPDMRPVSGAMTVDIPLAALTDDLEQVFDRIRDTPEGVVGVRHRDGRLAGYISRDNIAELMMLHMRDRH